MSLEKRYAYTPRIWLMALTIVFFSACAWIISLSAMTNDRGLTIMRFIAFSTSSATIVLWFLAAASVLFVFLGAYGLMKAMFGNDEIVIAGGQLFIPKPFQYRPLAVQLSDVSALSDHSISRQHFLRLHAPNGNATVNKGYFGDDVAYEGFRRDLEAAILNARAEAHTVQKYRTR